MIKLFSTSFLILLTVISCANVFNVITTSLNMRKREFAVLRSVGMTVNKLFAFCTKTCGMVCLRS
ncbi:MAG: FtsX-like permease family protein [[Eubacterium] siraeum]